MPGHAHKVLVVVDALNPLLALCSSSSASAALPLPHLLGGLITSPTISLVALHHTDVPVAAGPGAAEYEPHPLTVVAHLATAVLRVGSLHHAARRREARNRSLVEPEWGLHEGREGVLVGLQGAPSGAAAGPGKGKGNGGGGDEAVGDGLVLEMEVRRRSGRSVGEKFVLVPGSDKAVATGVLASKILLLADHPLFRDPADEDEGQGGEGDEAETTFSLGLTEKQRRDREGIVLPYFDAQTDIGAGEGGRILYEMGREDDFDDEEDEI
jgi:elongator complex protein 5